MRRLLAVVLLAAMVPVPGATQNLGAPTGLGTAARDLHASFGLPPLRDAAGSELARQLADLQLGRRARALGLSAASANEAWRDADATLKRARSRLATPPPQGVRVFAGSRASQLNALLRDPAVPAVRSISARIDVDEPIALRRPGLWLDLGETELRPSGDAPTFLLRVENAPRASVRGGSFAAGRWAILVRASADVTLQGGRFEGLRKGGVVLSHAPGAVLAQAALRGLGGAAVLVHGDTVGAALLGNEIVAGTATSNWHAGIVVSDRNGEVGQDPDSLLQSDGHWVREQRIDERLRVPRGNVIAFNRVAMNASSGIYSDGGVQNVLFDNLIEGNGKEGLCLDNGSTANVVAMNVIRQNGKRWGQSDEALRLDFVLARGRLPDGTSVAKTPGVSIDNAAYNIVYANQVDRNHGGGVKMVRTAFFNLVGLNVVTDNNEGASPVFHFFGIELGATRADAPAVDLDFTPSRGNIVFGNVVRGSHYAGIFYGAGSTDNDVFDNSIFGATHWAQEQVRPQPNPSLNNLSNLPSRNIGSGLDPKLLELSRGRFD